MHRALKFFFFIATFKYFVTNERFTRISFIFSDRNPWIFVAAIGERKDKVRELSPWSLEFSVVFSMLVRCSCFLTRATLSCCSGSFVTSRCPLSSTYGHHLGSELGGVFFPPLVMDCAEDCTLCNEGVVLETRFY